MNITAGQSGKPWLKEFVKSPTAFIARLSPQAQLGLIFLSAILLGLPLALALNWYSLSH